MGLSNTPTSGNADEDAIDPTMVYKPQADLESPRNSSDAYPPPRDQASFFALETAFSGILRAFNTLLPPSRRVAIYAAVLAHPLLSTFLVCQIVCAAAPLGFFLAGVLLSAVLAAMTFACCAFLILVPALAATAILGLFLWIWAWTLFLFVRWVGRYYQMLWKEGRTASSRLMGIRELWRARRPNGAPSTR